MVKYLSSDELLMLDYLGEGRANQPYTGEMAVLETPQRQYGMPNFGSKFATITETKQPNGQLKGKTVLSVLRKLEKKKLVEVHVQRYQARRGRTTEARMTKKGWLAYAKHRDLPIHKCEDLTYPYGVLNHSSFVEELWAKEGRFKCYNGLVDERTDYQMGLYRWWDAFDD